LTNQNSQIELSVVIVNYNVRYFLEQCLLSVIEATNNINSEIIVVDNNSTDDSCKIINTKYKNVILLENKQNVGFSKANNQGVNIAKGKYILILNPDTVLAENTIEIVMDFAKSKTNLGAIGVQFMDGSGNFLPECKRGIPTPKVALGKLLGFPKKTLEIYYSSYIDKNQNNEIEILTGAFMLLKKQVYNEVNGFDEDYFMYGEDIDLSYKILKKSYKNYYIGKTTIIHYKGESTTKDKKYLKRFYGAMEIFYKKHFKINPLSNLLMLVGIKLWYFINLFTANKNEVLNTNNNKRIIYIGKNETTFSKIKTKLKPEIAIFIQNIMEQDIISNKPSKIIFDMNFLSYNDVFKTIKIIKSHKISFRFIPKNKDFLIGSDTNKFKGESILLK
jgi:GT2 family glycosyltransferase